RYQRLLDTLAADGGIVILSGREPWAPPARGPLGVLSVPFPIPEFAQRRACWQTHLAALGITLDDNGLGTLASRFRLLPDQIAEATVTAYNQVLWRVAAQSPGTLSSPSGVPLTLRDLLSAGRAQSGHDLATLA